MKIYKDETLIADVRWATKRPGTIINPLIGAGMRTVGDVRRMTRERLGEFVGRTSLATIDRQIGPLGQQKSAVVDVVVNGVGEAHPPNTVRWLSGRELGEMPVLQQWRQKRTTGEFAWIDVPTYQAPSKEDIRERRLKASALWDYAATLPEGDPRAAECQGERNPPAGGPSAHMTEAVNHPSHYGGEDNPYEAIKVIEAWGLGFHAGNTVKYIARAGKKGDKLQDLKKARWYLDREIKRLEEGLARAT